jgi:hypothetical protein
MQKILSNNDTLTVTPSDFLVADELRIAIINSINKMDLGLGKSFNLFNLQEAFSQELDFEKIIKSALFLTADKQVLECFWECAKKATVGKNIAIVNKQFFEPEENRELFIEIFIAVLEVNVKSFFTGIIKALTSYFGQKSQTVGK